MKKEDKERIVATLTERLRTSETLLVADYRGLTMPQIDALRSRLLESGATFTVVKNTLTRRAAEAAGADALLALLEGPSAIAFLDAEGDMVAAAKALADMARDSKVLAVRGGVLQGRTMSAEEVQSIATLPPVEILRGQVLGAVIAPLGAFAGLVNAPLQSLHGLLEARIEQLGGEGTAPAEAAEAAEAPVAEAEAPAAEAAAAAAAPAEPEAATAADDVNDTESTETEDA